ncbi:phage tail terminator-like protein [Stutzerimonas nitrititolerans]|uniref:phage tail terminator-like protein n=1 Tax=Stutzerimonas nitrititolerans TaxID=2482751 RepID=UPI00289A3917|nr:phage tail terminator-like protein [Stutzerimonas nitrititolerans]
MSQKLIRSLFELRLAEFAAAISIPVAWENVRLNPPAGQYLRFDLLKSPTDSSDLAGAHREYSGVCQISIFAPKGTGPAVAETLAADLEVLFPLNLRLASGEFAVQIITPCSEGPSISGDTHFMVPVSFTYRADTI